MLAKKRRYDYYTVKLPSDLVYDNDSWLENMSDYAIHEARERARLYCIPCNWSVELVSGSPDSWESVFRVTRIR